jgi:hypothetical protein
MSEEALVIPPDAICDLLKVMPDSTGLRYENDKNTTNHIIKKIDAEYLAELSKDNGRANIVTMLDRNGSAYYMNYLEYNYFNPYLEINNSFNYMYFKWQHLIWIIASIPAELKQNIFDAAEKCGLTIQDGVPTIFSVDGVNTFPLNNANTFCLGNKKDDPIYKGFSGQQDAQVEEHYKIKVLREQHLRNNLELKDWTPSVEEIEDLENQLKNNLYVSYESATFYAIKDKPYVYYMDEEINDDYKKASLIFSKLNKVVLSKKI